MKIGRLIGIVCIVIIIGIVAYWVLPWRSDATRVEDALDSSAAQQKPVANGKPEAGRNAEILSPRSALSDASPIYMLDLVASTRQLDADLMLRANAGDIEAMDALLILSIRCNPFWPSLDDQDHPRHELTKANLDPGSSEYLERARALAKMTAYCDRPYAPGELRERNKRFKEQLAAAAKNGDVVAQAALFFEGQTEDEIVRAFAQTDRAWVAENALSAFAIKNGPLAREIEREVFPETLLYDRQQINLIKISASQWLGCQRGRPCGPDQFQQLSNCYFAVDTCVSMSVTNHLRNQQLSDYQFMLMQRYLAAVESRLGRRG